MIPISTCMINMKLIKTSPIDSYYLLSIYEIFKYFNYMIKALCNITSLRSLKIGKYINLHCITQLSMLLNLHVHVHVKSVLILSYLHFWENT